MLEFIISQELGAQEAAVDSSTMLRLALSMLIMWSHKLPPIHASRHHLGEGGGWEANLRPCIYLKKLILLKENV